MPVDVGQRVYIKVRVKGICTGELWSSGELDTWTIRDPTVMETRRRNGPVRVSK